MAKEILKPCPWCGTIPEVEPWEGEKPTTHMVSCASEECKAGPSVIGGTSHCKLPTNQTTGALSSQSELSRDARESSKAAGKGSTPTREYKSSRGVGSLR